MLLYDLWMVSPQHHVFIRNKETVTEYVGGKAMANSSVKNIKAVKYPCHGIVFEVELEK